MIWLAAYLYLMGIFLAAVFVQELNEGGRWGWIDAVVLISWPVSFAALLLAGAIAKALGK